jgi:biopolymer transport protein TolR
MAISPIIGKPGGRARYRPLSDINVTPLVDVMLVLLIIFMVTAPLMTSGVSVDLPKTDAKPLNTDSEPLTVSINAEGKIFLQNQEVQIPELVSKLQAVSQNDNSRRIFVRGDKDISYGLVMQVMGTITEGGFTKVALLAQPPTTSPAATPATPPPASSPTSPPASPPTQTAPAAPGAPAKAG